MCKAVELRLARLPLIHRHPSCMHTRKTPEKRARTVCFNDGCYFIRIAATGVCEGQMTNMCFGIILTGLHECTVKVTENDIVNDEGEIVFGLNSLCSNAGLKTKPDQAAYKAETRQSSRCKSLNKVVLDPLVLSFNCSLLRRRNTFVAPFRQGKGARILTTKTTGDKREHM